MNTKKQNKKKKGFTLIELIIVIAIIAILAAIAIPNFLSIQRKSKVKADIASAKTIYDATSALIAQGEIVPNNGEIQLKLTPGTSGEKGTVTVVTAKGTQPSTQATKAAENLQKYMQVIPYAKTVENGEFQVKIDGKKDLENPSIVISIDEKTVYPNGVSPYNLEESKPATAPAPSNTSASATNETR